MRLLQGAREIALFAIAGCLALAQTNGAGSIEGYVIDGANGLPIAGARVGCGLRVPVPGKVISCGALSDVEGKFRVANVAPGDYYLVASADQYISSDYITNVTVAADQIATGFRLRLNAFASISGRITDADQKPLAGIEVRLWRVSYFGGQRGFHGENQWAHTDRDGTYRLAKQKPGRYYLSAGPSERSEKANGDVRYVQSYYPGTFDPEAAAPIDLLPGVDLADINFKLSKVHTVRVSGQVMSPRVADLRLSPESFLFDSATTKSAMPDGKFEFEGVVPGLYRLRVRIRTPKPDDKKPADIKPVAVREDEPELWAVQMIPVGANGVEGLKISPRPLGVIIGHVSLDGGDPDVDVSKFAFELYQVDPGPGGVVSGARAKNDGVFTIDDVLPGRFRLGRGNGPPEPPGYYIKSVRSGSRQFPDRVLDLNFSGSQNIEITMSAKAASVTGTVLFPDSDRTAARVRVILVPQDSDRKDDQFSYLKAFTDESGKFKIGDVPPGRYRAFAWETVDEYTNVYMDPYFIGPLESKGVALRLAESDSADIKLTLIVGH